MLHVHMCILTPCWILTLKSDAVCKMWDAHCVHLQTALDTGGGKESMYINIPYAPPPTSVQGLCKTLAKRRCVELPRGALK